jgi:hypothetical protein
MSGQQLRGANRLWGVSDVMFLIQLLVIYVKPFHETTMTCELFYTIVHANKIYQVKEKNKIELGAGGSRLQS